MSKRENILSIFVIFLTAVSFGLLAYVTSVVVTREINDSADNRWIHVSSPYDLPEAEKRCYAESGGVVVRLICDVQNETPRRCSALCVVD